MSSSFFRRVVLASAVATLAACGGGGGGSSGQASGAPSGPTGPSTPSQSGTLFDSEVAGVSYTTSGGYSGVTDKDGHFHYNAGETVTFKIGEVTLGAVKPTVADATFTPIELATTNGVTDASKATKLLVLLQSLDSDGDPSNGINIPTAAANALTGSGATTLSAALINAAVVPEDFATTAQLGTVLTTIKQNDASVVTAQVVTVSAAQAHFAGPDFFSRLAGTWTVTPGPDELIVFRFDDAGNYAMGEIAEADESGHSGIEHGRILRNPTSGEITVGSVDHATDTNGQWGLSDMNGEKLFFTLSEDSKTLTATIKVEGKPDDVLTVSRVQPDSGIVGGWGIGSGTDFNTQQVVFLNDGTYVMLDPLGDTDPASHCGGPGLEFGHYLFTPAQGNVSAHLSTSAIIEDTNGCAGLHDPNDGDDIYGEADLTLNGNTMTLKDGSNEGAGTMLYRTGVVTPP